MTNQTHNIDGNPFCVDSAALAAVIAAGTPGACGVVPPPPPPVEPPGRLKWADVSYGLTNPARISPDCGEFANAWGRFKTTDSPMLFPGAQGSAPVIHGIDPHEYIAAHFRTGPVVGHGMFTFPHGTSPICDFKLSTAIGDWLFDPANPAALMLRGRPIDNIVLAYGPGRCILLPNTDYFLNIRPSDPRTAAWDANLIHNFTP